MDKDTLPESLGLLKYAFQQQEQLTQTLFRAETLNDLVLRQDLTTYPLSKLHDCHLMLSDLTQQARSLSEILLSVIGKIISLFPPEETRH